MERDDIRAKTFFIHLLYTLLLIAVLPFIFIRPTLHFKIVLCIFIGINTVCFIIETILMLKEN